MLYQDWKNKLFSAITDSFITTSSSPPLAYLNFKEGPLRAGLLGAGRGSSVVVVVPWVGVIDTVTSLTTRVIVTSTMMQLS